MINKTKIKQFDLLTNLIESRFRKDKGAYEILIIDILLKSHELLGHDLHQRQSNENSEKLRSTLLEALKEIGVPRTMNHAFGGSYFGSLPETIFPCMNYLETAESRDLCYQALEAKYQHQFDQKRNERLELLSKVIFVKQTGQQNYRIGIEQTKLNTSKLLGLDWTVNANDYLPTQQMVVKLASDLHNKRKHENLKFTSQEQVLLFCDDYLKSHDQSNDLIRLLEPKVEQQFYQDYEVRYENWYRQWNNNIEFDVDISPGFSSKRHDVFPSLMKLATKKAADSCQIDVPPIEELEASLESIGLKTTEDKIEEINGNVHARIKAEMQHNNENEQLQAL